jgi:hypothetical protein
MSVADSKRRQRYRGRSLMRARATYLTVLDSAWLRFSPFSLVLRGLPHGSRHKHRSDRLQGACLKTCCGAEG